MDRALWNGISESDEILALVTDLARLADQLTHEISSSCVPQNGANSASWSLGKASRCAIDLGVLHAILRMAWTVVQPNWSWPELRTRRKLASMVRAYIRLAQALQRMRQAELAPERRAEFVHLASRLTAVAQPLAQMLCSRGGGDVFTRSGRQPVLGCSHADAPDSARNGGELWQAIFPAL
jgi:hypothetical protein